ncbi:calcium/proton exchanger [Fonsecaea erecta]|uniref:Vacuolar calcium ion transporter n=1 Tax=Fonsecaea erecta TaxID=1367422 RepID=A0A178ZVB9_9EURO|nr:calcium/proton exchanger [Fonsecaea erecta]OAP63193.1 calcium/proton exchanger [Fonsecaea erecta]
MGLFNHKNKSGSAIDEAATTNRVAEKPNDASDSTPASSATPVAEEGVLPRYNHNGHLITKGIHPDGESGRRGIHPIQCLKVIWISSCTVSSWVNLLWPFVPAAIALHFVQGDHHLWTFAINYIAMVPAANLLGFAGQEMARKLPKVMGILIETTLGSVVEIVLFMVLVVKDDGTGETGPGNKIVVIQAAILGSILTNLLLCLGSCFLVGGLRHKEQTFHAVISEAGSGLLLVAGFALLIPSAFYSSLSRSTVPNGEEGYTVSQLRSDTLDISHGVSVILIVAFALYLLYNSLSHDNIFQEVLEADEEADRDRHRDLKKPKLTMTECITVIAIALTFISLIAVFLVEEIEFVVANGVPDNFLGLILVPLVEKAAEHLTAVDEAYDNQINFALYHCLGPSIQTALFNAPLVVIVGWGLGKPMDLNFEIFMVVLLVMSILVVGNFLRDGASNYLEGSLLVIVYAIIALTAWYYPNSELTTSNGSSEGTQSSGGESTEALVHVVKMLMA